MTEGQWLACSELEPMLTFLHGRVSDRKFRLFACACCRRVWPALREAVSRAAVEVTERFCDGAASDEQRREAHGLAWGHYMALRERPARNERAASAAFAASSASAEPMPWLVGYDLRTAAQMAARGAAELAPDADDEQRRQADLLRDIAGPLPFRPARAEPAWLTSDVILLARGAYEGRAFDRLPILADALADAGCDDEEVLSPA